MDEKELVLRVCFELDSVHFRMPYNITLIDPLLEKVSEFTDRCGLDDDDLKAILREALLRVIGSAFFPEQNSILRCAIERLDRNRLQITIDDEDGKVDFAPLVEDLQATLIECLNRSEVSPNMFSIQCEPLPLPHRIIINAFCPEYVKKHDPNVKVRTN